ncbi:DMT family transporter [Patescibacteria group bacterium]|nr:DMT family transporter [Patescibacteria group bacterium]
MMMSMTRGKTKKKSRLPSYVFMIINTIVWGAALIVVKPAFEATTPFRFLLYRYIIAAILATPLLFHFLPKIKNLKKTLAKITLLEILGGTIALSLLYSGLNLTSAIEASLITTTTPIFVSIFAVATLKEKEEKHEVVGMAIAFAGTLLLTLFPLLNGYATIKDISLTGNLLIVGQNIATALYFILAKKHYQKLPKIFIATISFYVCLITFASLSAFETGGITQLLSAIHQDLQHLSVWVTGGYMAVFGSIIGLTAYLKGQEGIEASEATLFTYLQPLIYLPLGFWLLSEKIYPLQIGSLLIILLGVVIAQRRSWR